MRWSWLAWCLLTALLTFVPVGLRVLTWERPGSVNLDPEMVEAGEVLFNHEWQPNDPLCPNGDGLGPVYNANSCAACHQQGGVGGGGGDGHNVLTFASRAGSSGQLREGVLHNFSTAEKFSETLQDLHTSLPASGALALMTKPGPMATLSTPSADVALSQRRTPALFGAGLIDAIPYRAIVANERKQRLRQGMSGKEDDVPLGRLLHLGNGRVGKFGWKAQTATLSDFVQAACANELGLGNPGQAQPTPLGDPGYRPVGLDLTLQQCDQITAFVASLPRPVEKAPIEPALRHSAVEGKALFSKMGCADCHTPTLGSVEGIYSDLLLHKMGMDLSGSGSTYYGHPRPGPNLASADGPRPDEWRTPPLWGVADAAPYMHDGRAATLEDAILAHGGQGGRAQERYRNLGPEGQGHLLTFLGTLRAPQ